MRIFQFFQVAAKLVLDTPALEKLVLWLGTQETRETAERTQSGAGRALWVRPGDGNSGSRCSGQRRSGKWRRAPLHPTPGVRWRLPVSTGTEWRVELG